VKDHPHTSAKDAEWLCQLVSNLVITKRSMEQVGRRERKKAERIRRAINTCAYCFDTYTGVTSQPDPSYR